MTKKVTNVIVLVALIIVMVVGVVVAVVLSGANREHTFEEGNFEFVIKGDNVAIKKFNNVDNVSEVKLPREVQGYTVTTIGKDAFKGDMYLKTIELDDNITSIESGAFENCKALNTVRMKSVVSIGDGAFKGDEMLSYVDMPESLESIGSEAFMNCTILRELAITFNDDFTPKSRLSSVGRDAFNGSRLTTMVIPSSMKNIGEGAFRGASLYKVIFYEGVEIIGNEAFLYYDNGGNSMNVYTFDPQRHDGSITPNMSNITSVSTPNEFPTTLRSIGDGAFKKGTSNNSARLNLGTVAFGERLSSIGKEAFVGATISNISFKNAKTTIGAFAFSDLYSTVYEFVFPSELEVIEEGVLFSTDMRSGGKVVIPATVRTLGARAFSGSKTQYTISFAEGSPLKTRYKFETGDGYNALMSADGKILYSMIMGSSSKSFTIPASVEVIDSYAFTGVGMDVAGSPSVGITIPAHVREIRANAFSDSGITSIDMMHKGDLPISISPKTFDNITSANRYVVRAYPNSALLAELERTFASVKNVEVNTLSADSMNY